MSDNKFPTVFFHYIRVYFTLTKNGYEQHSEDPAVDLAFREPHLDTHYDSEEV